MFHNVTLIKINQHYERKTTCFFVVSEFKQKFTAMKYISAENIENKKFCLTKTIHWLEFSLLKVHSLKEILQGVEWEKIQFYKFCSLLKVFTEKRVTTQRFD